MMNCLANKIRITILLTFIVLSGFASIYVASQGIIPWMNFQTEEVGKIISPQMGTRHLNQPIVFGGYAIMAGNAEHEVWDISNPYDPVFIGEMTSSYKFGEAESHQVTLGRVNGRFFMATTSGKGIDIWDISKPTTPSYIKAIEIPGVNYGDVDNAVWGLSWQGTHIFVGATNHGLFVIDVSDMESPEIIKNVPISEMDQLKPGPLFALGDLLVITSPKGNNGVATLDISNPNEPLVLDVINYRNAASYIGGFYGSHAVLISPLRFFDVTSDPSHIRLTASMNVPSSEYISFDENHLFLGGLRGGSQGIHKYDISDLTNISKTLHIPGRDSRWDDQFSAPVGNLVLIADDQLVDGQYVGGIIAVHKEDKDTLGPTVLQTMPHSNSWSVAVSGKLGISFSDWIDFRSVDSTSFFVKDGSNNIISGSYGWNYTTINFTPDSPLVDGNNYTLTLPQGGIKDLSGNGLQETFQLAFQTKQREAGPSDPVIDEIVVKSINAPVSWSITNPYDEYEYIWTLNDQIVGEGSSVTHTIPTPGRHSACLKVYNQNENPSYIFEAEDATLSPEVSFRSDHAGYSGSGFVDFPASEGDSISVSFDLLMSKTDTIDIEIGYANGSEFARPLNLYLDNEWVQEFSFSSTNGWTTYHIESISSLSLEEGLHQLSLVANAGSIGPNIDHLTITQGMESIRVTGELIASQCFLQIVTDTSEARYLASKKIILHNNLIWTVNPDSETITAISAETNNKVKEIPVGKTPKSLTVVRNNIWVVNRDDHSIDIVNPSAGVVSTLQLPYASQPTHILASDDEKYVYVSLSAASKVLKISTFNGETINELALGTDETSPILGGLSIDTKGNKLLVNRFISNGQYGEVFIADTETMKLINTIQLNNMETTDASNRSRGIPNYMDFIAIRPDGKEAWVPSKQDNLVRGEYRDGLPLDHQTTVRAAISRIDLINGSEKTDSRIDIDNTERCNSISFNERGDLAFVTLAGNHKVAILDANSGIKITEITTQLLPDGSVLDNKTGLLYVHNFLSRSVSVLDINPILNGFGNTSLITNIPTVTEELLTEEILNGKRIFYDAASKKLNQSGYMSCASCHLDGSHDGNTWDLTSLGEGFRNTIDLRGRAGTGHGKLHWTANFDEVHDFENQIRTLGAGTGLMSASDFEISKDPLGQQKAGKSDDLDDLTAYVASLSSVPASPYKTNGSYSQNALKGAQIFTAFECGSCHSGTEFTDSPAGNLHDIGTIQENSGKRIGKTLDGFDTPTLKGIWNTAPYLHNGQAKTIQEAILAHNTVKDISENDLIALTQFLRELDEETIPVTTRVMEKTSDISIYPNPVSGSTCTVRSKENIAGWQIYNLDGTTLHSGSGQEIKTTDLRNGLYIVKILTSNGEYMRRMLVQR